MLLRPLRGLSHLLFALALLAGAPAATVVPAPASGLEQRQDCAAQTLTRDTGGLPCAISAVVPWADSDDDPEQFALVPTAADGLPPPSAAAAGCILRASPTPLSHWPCASFSTGPPSAE